MKVLHLNRDIVESDSCSCLYSGYIIELSLKFDTVNISIYRNCFALYSDELDCVLSLLGVQEVLDNHFAYTKFSYYSTPPEINISFANSIKAELNKNVELAINSGYVNLPFVKKVIIIVDNIV